MQPRIRWTNSGPTGVALSCRALRKTKTHNNTTNSSSALAHHPRKRNLRKHVVQTSDHFEVFERQCKIEHICLPITPVIEEGEQDQLHVKCAKV